MQYSFFKNLLKNFFIETTQQEHATRAATHGTGGCECSTKWKAPDDGHKGARNM
jgi:hypothetical protein